MADDYKFEKIYEGEIKEEEIDYYSSLFGEESPALTELIKYCMENGIKTFASCKGHPEEKGVVERLFEKGYISFRIDDIDDFTYFLASMPHRVEDIQTFIDYNFQSLKRSITIEVPATKKEMSELYFSKVLEEIKRYNETKEYETTDEVRKVVDYVLSNPCQEQFYIKNDKFIRVDSYNNAFGYKTASCPRGEQINKLHNLYCEITKKPKNVEDLINLKTK